MYSLVIDRENKSWKNYFRRFIYQTSLSEQQKHRFQKRTKLIFFPKALVHGFGEKYEILLTFRFIQKTPRKSIWWGSRYKQVFLDNINVDLKRRQNWHFCKGDSPWFWSKSRSFFIFVFIKNRSRKSVCWRSR